MPAFDAYRPSIRQLSGTSAGEKLIISVDIVYKDVVKVFIDGVELGAASVATPGNGRTDTIQYVAPASQHSGTATQTAVESLDNVKLYETPQLF